MKGLKESFRKLLVSLKRRPHMIPLLVFALAFLVYSLNLMNISDTTAKIQGKGMGLCGFATMLFSLLSLLCFLNAFPHRKRVTRIVCGVRGKDQGRYSWGKQERTRRGTAGNRQAVDPKKNIGIIPFTT